MLRLASGAVGIKRVYKPYLNSPSSLPGTPSATQGEVTYYEYVNDVFGAPRRVSLARVSVNGTTVSQTATS